MWYSMQLLQLKIKNKTHLNFQLQFHVEHEGPY